MFDGGQSCCENRYMNCDDDLDYFSGAVEKFYVRRFIMWEGCVNVS